MSKLFKNSHFACQVRPPLPPVRGVLAPPDTLTSRIRHKIRHACTRSASYVTQHKQRRYPNVPDRRSLPLHRIPCASVVKSSHPGAKTLGCQPYITSGTSRCPALWLWAQIFNLQGFANDEKGIQPYHVQPCQTGQFISVYTIPTNFTQLLQRRGTLSLTLRSLLGGLVRGSSPSPFTHDCHSC